VSIPEQASLILQASLAQHSGPFIVVGHSYGGPIALQLAMDAPENVSNMVILAGSADPELHHARWYHRLAGSWLGRRVIRAKTTVIQGGKDWLAPPGNANYMKQHLTSADVDVILLEEQNHFLPWNERALVKETLLGYLGEQGCHSLADR